MVRQFFSLPFAKGLTRDRQNATGRRWRIFSFTSTDSRLRYQNGGRRNLASSPAAGRLATERGLSARCRANRRFRHNDVTYDMLLCMRTTLDINDELLRQAKNRAADERTPLRQVVETALRIYLGKRHRPNGYKLRWRTEKGRLQPGVRLDDRDTLFDLMDGRL